MAKTARITTPKLAEATDVSISLLREDPNQPRQEFSASELAALAESIRTVGVRTPLRVRPDPDQPGHLLIVDGARRFRAAQAAGLSQLPCILNRAPSGLETFADQLIANALRADLPPQDDAAALLIIWLGRQVAAFGGDGNPPEGMTVSERIAALTERLCQLARLPDLEAYAGSGAVKIPWKDVLMSVGRGDWSDDRRKQHIRRIKHLTPNVMDAIIGVPMSAATVKDLNALPPDTQQDVLDDALRLADDDGTPLGDALRAALDERRGERRGGSATPPSNNGHDLDDVGDPDSEADLVLAGAPARHDAFDPDPALALLTTSNGHAPKLITDQAEPERGTPPPAGHDQWDNASFLVLHSGLEAVLTTLEDAGPRYFTEAQAARIAPLWTEIARRMQAAEAGVDK